jgi:hypothetical protein
VQTLNSIMMHQLPETRAYNICPHNFSQFVPASHGLLHFACCIIVRQPIYVEHDPADTPGGCCVPSHSRSICLITFARSRARKAHIFQLCVSAKKKKYFRSDLGGISGKEP